MTGVSEENDKALMVPSENDTVRLLLSITPECNANKAATPKISPTLQSQLPLSGAGS